MYSFGCFFQLEQNPFFFGSCITLSGHLNTQCLILFFTWCFVWFGWDVLVKNASTWCKLIFPAALYPSKWYRLYPDILLIATRRRELANAGIYPGVWGREAYLSELRGLEAAVPLFVSTVELVTPSHKLVYKPTEVVPDTWYTHIYIYIYIIVLFVQNTLASNCVHQHWYILYRL